MNTPIRVGGLVLLTMLQARLAPPAYTQIFRWSDPAQLALATSTTARTSNPWSVRYNPALLTSQADRSIRISAEPSVASPVSGNQGTVQVTYTLNREYTLHAELSHFSASSYRETVIGTAAATRVSEVLHVGAAIRVASLAIEHYGATLIPILDVGIVARPTEAFRIGLSSRNLTRSSVAGDQVPQTLSIGSAWHVDSNATLSADLHHSLDVGLTVATAITYRLLPRLKLRAGLTSRAATVGMGFTVGFNDVSFAYGASWSDRTGFRNVAGVGLTW